jgi:hypothetical protein
MAVVVQAFVAVMVTTYADIRHNFADMKKNMAFLTEVSDR